MSIYSSWPEIGVDHEADGYHPDGTVYSYVASHYYPRPDIDMPGDVSIAHIPGFIWRTGLSDARRDQEEDDPVAPFLRLTIGEWSPPEHRPMVAGDAILTRGVEMLRDQLTEWLERPMHDE